MPRVRWICHLGGVYFRLRIFACATLCTWGTKKDRPNSKLFVRSSESRTVTGVLHESLGHECLKSSLAFRKPATYADSRHPARTEGL